MPTPSRNYFGSASDGTIPLPQTNGAWTASSISAARRCMARKSLVAGIASVESWTTGQTKAHRVFVLDQHLRGGPVTGTVKCQIAGSESNANMNIRPRLEVYVVSADLGTVRGTLLAIANYGSGNEVATTQTGITFADGDAMSLVNAQPGDRIAVVVGGTDTAGTTPGLSLYFGGTDADSPEDESTTGNKAGWIEFSDESIFVPTPTPMGVFSNPVDGAAATNTADPTSCDFATNLPALAAGDLVCMVAQYRGTSATLAISNAGGQSWNSEPAVSNTNVTMRLFWCRFNGTWSATPSVDFPAATCNTVAGIAFRPTQNTMYWAVDQALVELDFTAGSSPFTKTVTGQTTTKANSVTIAGWASVDNNTYGGQAGSSWTAPKNSVDGVQYRNVAGSDQSMALMYKIQPVPGATGNVSLNQLTLGGDAGTTFVITFYEYTPSVSPVSAPSINTSFSGTTGNVSLSSLSVTPGNLLLYAVGQYNDSGSNTIGAPSDPSGLVTTWYPLDSASGTGYSGGTQAGGIWVYWGIATSGTTLTQTLHASHTQYRGTLTEVPGGVGIGVHGASQGAGVTSRTVSMAGALSTSLNIAYGYVSGANGVTPSSGWTEDQDILTFMYHTVQHELPATTGSITLVEAFGSSRDMMLVACEVQGAPLYVPKTHGRFPLAAMQGASL